MLTLPWLTDRLCHIGSNFLDQTFLYPQGPHLKWYIGVTGWLIGFQEHVLTQSISVFLSQATSWTLMKLSIDDEHQVGLCVSSTG